MPEISPTQVHLAQNKFYNWFNLIETNLLQIQHASPDIQLQKWSSWILRKYMGVAAFIDFYFRTETKISKKILDQQFFEKLIHFHLQHDSGGYFQYICWIMFGCLLFIRDNHRIVYLIPVSSPKEWGRMPWPNWSIRWSKRNSKQFDFLILRVQNYRSKTILYKVFHPISKSTIIINGIIIRFVNGLDSKNLNIRNVLLSHPTARLRAWLSPDKLKCKSPTIVPELHTNACTKVILEIKDECNGVCANI